MQTNTLNKIIFLAAVFFIFLTASRGYTQEVSKLEIFYSPSCHRCAELKKKAIPAMEKKFKALRFVGTVYKVLGIIAGVLTAIGAIGSCLFSILGGSLITSAIAR